MTLFAWLQVNFNKCEKDQSHSLDVEFVLFENKYIKHKRCRPGILDQSHFYVTKLAESSSYTEDTCNHVT